MTVWCSRSRLTKLRLGQALGHGFGGLVVLRLLVLLRGEVGGAPAGAEGESARRQLDQRVYVGVVGVVDLRRVEGLTDLAVLCEAGGVRTCRARRCTVWRRGRCRSRVRVGTSCRSWATGHTREWSWRRRVRVWRGSGRPCWPRRWLPCPM